ncbi:aminopeptidase P family protein [Actinomadura barringtoniae]|uniref:Aminopeptidase P family protein n=1 Tax=Actinomadura barringtoniae TaxID=1427535 RepID=A0A939PPC6_9ACTN|nr:M24 family metallopeptidase [Actinomadura barringtoniae]MBO2453659.1 aminopeptidase P family protein [Actinomadura barringtoniae]
MRSIRTEEYLARQEAGRHLAAEAGLDGLIAWSRGGSSQDGYADVYYFSGYYQHQPWVPDVPGLWRAQGHTAFLLPVQEPAILLTDAGVIQDPQPAADRVRTDADLVEALAEEIRTSIPSGRLGILGCSTMAWPWWTALRSALPDHELTNADALGWRLRRVKSPAELDLLRTSGAVGVRAMDSAMAAAVPGAAEAEVAATAIAEIVSAGGAYYGMGISSGDASHTFAPSGPGTASATRHLKEGDLLRIDMYGSMEGYLFDFARTRVVGGDPTTEQREMLDAVHDSVTAGMPLLHPGQKLSDIARRCEEAMTDSAFALRQGAPDSQMGGAWGHGLGLSFEPPWVTTDADEVLEPGMCLALERRIAAPALGGANYEDNVLITETGPEIITPATHEYLH